MEVIDIFATCSSLFVGLCSLSYHRDIISETGRVATASLTWMACFNAGGLCKCRYVARQQNLF